MTEPDPRIPSIATAEERAAVAIADETIAFWRAHGVDYSDVWWALGQRSNCGGWGRVRQYMVRWQAAHAG